MVFQFLRKKRQGREQITVQEDTRLKVKLEVYRDRGKRYRWRLRTMNNKIIADSGEAYQNRQDCLDMVMGVVRGCSVQEQSIEHGVGVVE